MEDPFADRADDAAAVAPAPTPAVGGGGKVFSLDDLVPGGGGGAAPRAPEADDHEGEVWDEVEARWLSSEEAARREVARAQAWAEDLTRDHLEW